MKKRSEIENIDVDTIFTRPRNPNVMAEADLDRLADVIRKTGMLQPLLVRERPLSGDAADDAAARLGDGWEWEVIDGAHRLEAAKRAGLTHVPCVVVEATEEEAAALQIAMNRLRGELDLGAVSRELDLLLKAGWAVSALEDTGFAPDEITTLLESLKEPDEAEIIGAGLEDTDPAPTEGGEFILEIPFEDRKAMQRARRTLKKQGHGDVTAGLLAILDGDD